jgi:hypothetical protein
MTTHNNVSLTGRRAELMAELFLQELKPRFVAQAALIIVSAKAPQI